MDFRLGSVSKSLLGGLAALGMVIGPIAAIVLFLAGISGSGNRSLVTLALVALVTPFVLPFAFSALYAVANEATQNILGLLAKILLAAVGIFVVVVVAFQIVFYFT